MPIYRGKDASFKTLQPDFAFIHVPKADCKKCNIYGPRWDEDAAKAADKLLLLLMKLYPQNSLFLVEEVKIPACRVSMVVHQPSSHPHRYMACMIMTMNT